MGQDGEPDQALPIRDQPSPQAHAHIALAEGTVTEPHASTTTDNGSGGSGAPQGSPGLRNSKGWDGKLRLPKKTAVLANPEALSDPDYSDEDNVVPGEVISADEDLLNSEDSDTDEINYTHARIHSLTALHLERFKKCQRLCLRQNSIVGLIEKQGDSDKDDNENDSSSSKQNPLSCLADSLQDLDLYDNLITHMRGVEALPKLTSLDFSFNKIKHIKHLAGLTSLTDLYLVANKISTIEGLETLHRLRQLELGSNRIREITGLQGLHALEELWLAKNKIVHLDGLGGLPHLRLLSLQANRIRDLSPLAAVPTLEELYLSHNALESLESLLAKQPIDDDNVENKEDKGTLSTRSILPKLRVLDVGNNKLTSLHGIEGMAALEEVWASYNGLSDFVDVERTLADKKSLNTVYFEGNPLQLRAPALYRNKVRLALPQVQQIDATYVRD